MKLSRKHEIVLINIGIETLLDKAFGKVPKRKKREKKVEEKEETKEEKPKYWTQDPKTKAKISRSMKKIWAAKKLKAKKEKV